MPRDVTTTEAAAELNITVDAVCQRAKTGKLPAHKDDKGRWLVMLEPPGADLDETYAARMAALDAECVALPIDTDTATAYDSTPKLGKYQCGECELRVRNGRTRFGMPLYDCTVLGEEIRAAWPACIHFRRSGRSAAYETARREAAKRDPRPRRNRNKITDAGLAARQSEANAARRERVSLPSGNRCPRCGGLLLRDYLDVICLMCGTQEDNSPRTPSPFGQIWPPQGRV